MCNSLTAKFRYDKNGLGTEGKVHRKVQGKERSKGRERRPKQKEEREEGIEKMDQGRKVQGKEGRKRRINRTENGAALI